MGATICKQPNGKYARYSSVVDDFTDINMTEDDYIQLCVKRATENAIAEAKEILQHRIYKIEEVIESWRFSNLDNENLPPEDKPKVEERLRWLMDQMTSPEAKWNEL
jgi:predicted component of type VI protein secretion system